MSVYHQGELAVQHRLGQNDIAARLGRMVGDTVPDVAADFLAAQPMIVLAHGKRHDGIVKTATFSRRRRYAVKATP